MRCFRRGLIAALVLAAGAAVIPAAASAQQSVAEAEAPEVRIVARRLESGRVEFAMQHLGGGGEWGERMLPSRRFFPTTARVGRWLHSSSLSIDTTPATELRIVARRLESGGIEFGLQRRGIDDEWGEGRLPRRRFFPSDAAVGRWLASSSLAVGAGAGSAEGHRSGQSLIAVSNGRTCVVRPDGNLHCWGHHGRRENTSASLLDGVVAVAVGQQAMVETHSCALHASGTVSCWGRGFYGQLGQGDAREHWLPVEVPGITDAVSIAAGASHTCAVHDGGRVSCWGANDLGQLGDGTLGPSARPQRVPGLRGVESVASSAHFNCAVHVDGSVSCWGWAGTEMTPEGLRGDHLSPRRVAGLAMIDSISVGFDRACAVDEHGRVYCWRFTEGSQRMSPPERIAAVDDAVAVSAGWGSVCVVHRDGGVSCWGEDNSSGQLGDGSTSLRSRPARLRGISDAVAVAVSPLFYDGEAHACAVRGDGSVSCWGGNGFGQLGDGSHEARLLPVHIERFDDFAVDRIPADLTEFLRTWLDAVVADLEPHHPWIRLAWDHVREQTSFTRSTDRSVDDRSFVSVSCGTPDGSLACRASGMVIKSMDLRTTVHELGHVYDVTTSLTPDRVWGAVQVYFNDRYGHCAELGWHRPETEILAEGMRVITLPQYEGFREYVDPPSDDTSGCRWIELGERGEPERVIRSGFAGEVPEWYAENIKSGADLWAALRRAANLFALPNMQHEFGGFCPAEWLSTPFSTAEWPPAGENPFRDSGC